MNTVKAACGVTRFRGKCAENVQIPDISELSQDRGCALGLRYMTVIVNIPGYWLKHAVCLYNTHCWQPDRVAHNVAPASQFAERADLILRYPVGCKAVRYMYFTVM